MSAQPHASPATFAVSKVEESLAVAIEIARRGYAAPVIRLAVLRKGLAADSAEVVAILAQRLAMNPVPISPDEAAPLLLSDNPARYEDNKGLAAIWVLRSLSRFFLYAVLALGGGAAVGLGIGWEIGFTEGTEDSARRVADLLKVLGLY